MEERNVKEKKKLKVLCLHGFRTSGSFLHKQISTKWGGLSSILSQHFDLVFPDGIFAGQGKSEIEGIFPPPYFEWFQYNQDFTEYTNLEECISWLCDYITSKGPFDGLLGFSQGATLSALLIGYQAQGKVLKDHPPMELLISISGSKFRDPSICEIAYKDPIKVRSIHFIGAKDWLRLPSEELASAFESPLIIRHPQGHTVPRLDDEAIKQLSIWTMEVLQSCNNATEHRHSMSNEEAMVTEQTQPEAASESPESKKNPMALETKKKESLENAQVNTCKRKINEKAEVIVVGGQYK